jgi:methionyl-tRNA formyltransferase
MFKVGCYITGSKGLAVLETLINYKGIQIEFVTFEKNIGVKGNSFDQIKTLCDKHNLSVLEKNKKTPNVDIKFAAGWKWILKDYDQLIIIHDSILPRLKGFTPLVTALINGDDYIGSTAFWASGEYDCGNILYQTKNKISKPVRIADAIDIVESDYVTLTKKILNDLMANRLTKGIVQDSSKSSYSMWRDQEDYRINWNLTIEEIQRFVYAVGHPFEGAFSIINGEKIRITDCEILADINIENRTNGKVFSIANNQPNIVAKNGLIKITNATDDSGEPYRFKTLKNRLH